MTDLRTAQITLRKKIKGYIDKCNYCGEDTPEILQLHHIKPVAEGGSNSPDNLILLCPNCHIKAHKGLISPEALKEVASYEIYKKAISPDTYKPNPDMIIEVKREINSICAGAGYTLCSLIKKLRSEGVITTTYSNFMNKLNKGTLMLAEVLTIYEYLGYKLSYKDIQTS